MSSFLSGKHEAMYSRGVWSRFSCASTPPRQHRQHAEAHSARRAGGREADLVGGVLVVIGDAQMGVLAHLPLRRGELPEHELQQRRLARLRLSA